MARNTLRRYVCLSLSTFNPAKYNGMYMMWRCNKAANNNSVAMVFIS